MTGEWAIVLVDGGGEWQAECEIRPGAAGGFLVRPDAPAGWAHHIEARVRGDLRAGDPPPAVRLQDGWQPSEHGARAYALSLIVEWFLYLELPESARACEWRDGELIGESPVPC